MTRELNKHSPRDTIFNIGFHIRPVEKTDLPSQESSSENGIVEGSIEATLHQLRRVIEKLGWSDEMHVAVADNSASLPITSNQNSGIPWSDQESDAVCLRRANHNKPSVIRKHFSEACPSVDSQCSSSSRSRIGATDGIFSGDASPSSQSNIMYQYCENAECIPLTRDTNKDARIIDFDSIDGHVRPNGVNELETRLRSPVANMSANVSCMQCLSETCEQMTSNFSDRYNLNMRCQQEEDVSEETQLLDNFGDLHGMPASCCVETRESSIQECAINRMLEILHNLQDVLFPHANDGCPRALDIVNYLSCLLRNCGFGQAFEASQEVSCQDLSRTNYHPSTCTSTASFLNKAQDTELMNHTSMRIARGKTDRPNACDERWLKCPLELGSRENLNSRIKRVICALYCELQPLEDDTKEKALEMLEEIQRIVETLRTCEQSEECPFTGGEVGCTLEQGSKEEVKCETILSVSQACETEKVHQETDVNDYSCKPTSQCAPYQSSIEDLRSRIQSLILDRCDLTSEETNRKILSVLSDMERVLDDIGEQNPTLKDADCTDAKSKRLSDTEQPPILATPRMSECIEKLEDLTHCLCPNVDIPNYEPEPQICYLLNLLTDKLQTAKVNANDMENTGVILCCLENELVKQGAGNTVLAVCLREMREVVGLYGANLRQEEECRPASCDAACQEDGEIFCRELCVDEKSEESACEIEEIPPPTCCEMQVEEKPKVCRIESFEVHVEICGQRRITSGRKRTTSEAEEPTPGNAECTPRNIYAPTKSPCRVDSKSPGPDADPDADRTSVKVARILAELRDLMEKLETEAPNLEDDTVSKLLKTFNDIEEALSSDPQYHAFVQDVKRELERENKKRRKSRKNGGRDSRSSRWSRMNCRSRNRSSD